jgi:hypothetical protein
MVTYSWNGVTNATPDETLAFANSLIAQVYEASIPAIQQIDDVVDEVMIVACDHQVEVSPKLVECLIKYTHSGIHLTNFDIVVPIGEWRLPTIAELLQIYKHENDFEKAKYWTSDECPSLMSDQPCVRWLDFTDGRHGVSDQSFHLYFRPVRNIK